MHVKQLRCVQRERSEPQLLARPRDRTHCRSVSIYRRSLARASTASPLRRLWSGPSGAETVAAAADAVPASLIAGIAASSGLSRQTEHSLCDSRGLMTFHHAQLISYPKAHTSILLV